MSTARVVHYRCCDSPAEHPRAKLVICQFQSDLFLLFRMLCSCCKAWPEDDNLVTFQDGSY